MNTRLLLDRTGSRAAVGSLGTILSIWAHPDDETYLAGGLMAMARDGGQRVVCATASAGEHGTAEPDVWPPERLDQVRRWEAAAAMAVLGVAEHHVLGLPGAGVLGDAPVGQAWVERLIDHVQPDTIVTFGPDGVTHHPDHVAVHRWVVDAWRGRGAGARLLLATPTVDHLDRFGDLYEALGVYLGQERPDGVGDDELAVHLRLDGFELDRKLAALRAMATQTSGVIALLDPNVYAATVAEESFVDAVR